MISNARVSQKEADPNKLERVLGDTAKERELTIRKLKNFAIGKERFLSYQTSGYGGLHTAMDAVQDTFCYLSNGGLRNFDESRPLMPYLMSKVHWELISTTRKAKKRKEIPLDWVEYKDDSALCQDEETGQIDQSDLTDKVLGFINQKAQIGTQCFQALKLHYLHGFTYERVAETLEIPKGTAKSRISYALATLRKRFQYEFIA